MKTKKKILMLILAICGVNVLGVNQETFAQNGNMNITSVTIPKERSREDYLDYSGYIVRTADNYSLMSLEKIYGKEREPILFFTKDGRIFVNMLPPGWDKKYPYLRDQENWEKYIHGRSIYEEELEEKKNTAVLAR